MSLAACAEIVRRGDPVRFRAAMSCPPPAREVLFPLYAFNVEVSRAPYASEEPMIAEMRLHWWREALEEIGAGGRVRSHEVTDPLAALVRERGLPVEVLDRAAAARRWDIWREPFEDGAAFSAHLERVAGDLAWVSALGLGAAAAEEEEAVRAGAWGAGLARWFLAVPEMEARGRMPLPDGREETVRALAREGLARLDAGRAARTEGAVLALRHGWDAGAVLKAAAREPGRVKDGRLGPGEARSALRLAWVAVRGRW
ncbi:squalene/phytoene synthase family protein [Histidinibacterium lentulum]|uniref:Phytoene synthase n=1 Tax=Histidinibacterium lentulum TaxID=2480588 RepID=A0A3N2R9W9_9RHOB|nr:squalene/phytoene synthase family protein [Histidinibacterium lentulum]ROU04270.1 phytoene synthase [Histidinibacterium lentulum]